MTREPIAVQLTRAAAPQLRRALAGYCCYEHRGLPPGTHVGTPRASLTLVVSLDAPVEIAGMPDPAQRPGAFGAFVGGLSAAPAVIRHDGVQHGIQIELTPLGARTLLGMPAAAIGAAVVPLEDVLGRLGGELPERLAAQPSWSERCVLLDELLTARLRQRSAAAPAIPPALDAAWHLTLASGGTLPVGELARRTGWSRRHLSTLFANEYGLSPKTLARVVRFDRARQLLAAEPRRTRSIAHVAAQAGYSDQAHLTREWQALAGTTPAAWLRTEAQPEQRPAPEQRPFVQDADAVALAGCAA